MAENIYSLDGKHVPSIEKRFWKFVSPEPNSGCWLWMGAVYDPHAMGYGGFWIKPRTIVAHRAAWMIFRGSIPDGMRVLHRCDVALCVNPDHLFLGTLRDNSQDMVAKGRKAVRRGAENNFTKLTAIEVLAIRSDTRRYRDIADAYQVSPAAVCMIKQRKNWKHL